MRIHTVVATYVLIFARFFNLTRENYILLLLTIGGVISAEMVNTSIEELCDKVSPEYNSLIKHAKDAAAGAVLILAVFAVVIGIILFWNFNALYSMYNFYVTHPFNLCAVIALTILSVIYIVVGPVGIKKFFLKIFSRKTNGGNRK